MKRYHKIAVILFFMGAFFLICPPEAEVFARFPAQIFYIPCYHSRPFFIKNLQSGQVSPVKRISVNEPGIAEVKIITPYELVIDARHPGSTMFIVWYENNKTDFFEVRVTTPRPSSKYKLEVIKGLRSSPRDSIIESEW